MPVIPDTDPSRAILDSFRISIAKRLSETLPLTLEQALAGVDYGKKGQDFTVTLPRFGLPEKVMQLAAKVIEGVSPLFVPPHFLFKFQSLTQFQPDEWIESIMFETPFLNFRLNTTNMISQVFNQVDTLSHSTPSGEPEYGSNVSGKGKKSSSSTPRPISSKSSTSDTCVAPSLVLFSLTCTRPVDGRLLPRRLGNSGTFISLPLHRHFAHHLHNLHPQFDMVAIGYQKYGSQEEFDKDPLMHLYNVCIKINKDSKINVSKDRDPRSKPRPRSGSSEWRRGRTRPMALLAGVEPEEVPGSVQSAQHQV
jgi:arginyl-tRNA synthetase